MDRIGDVHVADAVRVGLDRFVLDAMGSEALEQRLEPSDSEGNPARSRLRRVRFCRDCCAQDHDPERPGATLSRPQ